MKKRRIFLVLLWCCQQASAAENHTVASPTGEFLCEIRPGESETGQTVIFKDRKTNRTIPLWKSGRWTEVKWSPKDNWFAITDHWDGQASLLAVYKIEQNSDGKFMGLTKEYQTPGSGTLGIEWSLIRWLTPGGAVEIRRTVVIDNHVSKREHRGEEVFKVPLE